MRVQVPLTRIINYNLKSYTNQFNKFSMFSLYFLFASLISPYITCNINIFFSISKYNNQKILLKNSYIILSWFYYLSFFNSDKLEKKLRFFVLPTRQQIFTLTKAPIAHKLKSKEQYKFIFFLIKISFTNCLILEENITSVNQALLFLFLLKKNLPFFSSNLLILKNTSFKFSFSDYIFFSYSI